MTSLERLPISNDVVNSYFYPLLTMSIAGRLGFVEVTAPEEVGPYLEFGSWLREKRIAAKLASQPQAEIRARQKGLKLINQGKLSHIERGMNSNPDPEFLAQISKLYTLNYDEVVARWTRVKYGIVSDVDSVPSRHGGTGQHAPRQEGGADVPAEARVRELLDRVEAYEVILSKVRIIAGDLTATVGAQSGAAARPEARRGGGRRRNR